MVELPPRLYSMLGALIAIGMLLLLLLTDPRLRADARGGRASCITVVICASLSASGGE
jgi:hypothetical protein